MTTIFPIGNLAEDPNGISITPIPSSTVADWGTGSLSVTAGSGAPSGDLGATYYFDLVTFGLYVWDGATWNGPVLYTYSSEAPVSSTTSGPDYWVQGDESFNLTGGVFYRTLVVIPESPADGDVVAWSDTSNAWYPDGNVARLIADNNFMGAQTVEAVDVDDIALSVRGVSGQTANLFVVESHDGTDRFVVNNDGYSTTANVQAAGGFRVGTSVSYTTGQRWVSITNASTVPSAVTSGAIVYAEGGELNARTALANVGLTAKRVAVKTDAHTFEGADQGAIVVLNSGSNFDFTIPEDASVNFPVGTTIMVATQSTGHVTVVGSGAATVTGTTVLNTAGTIATLIKVAANTWLCHH